MSVRLAAGAAVGTTLVLALAACGTTGKAADAGPGGVKLSANEVMLKTSKNTASVSSFGADISFTGSAKGHNGTTHATGSVQLRPDIALTGTVDKASFGGFTLNSSIPVVLKNNVLYAKVPSQFSQFSSFTGGKDWVKVDLSKMGQRSGTDVASTMQEAANVIDPGSLTKTFTASKDVTKVGDESVNGTNTTHYKGTVTVKDALATLDAGTQAKLKNFYDKAGSKPIAFQLWADQKGLARKVIVSASSPSGETSTLTVIYSDFNKSVHVTPPPADQVGNLNVPGFGG